MPDTQDVVALPVDNLWITFARVRHSVAGGARDSGGRKV